MKKLLKILGITISIIVIIVLLVKLNLWLISEFEYYRNYALKIFLITVFTILGICCVVFPIIEHYSKEIKKSCIYSALLVLLIIGTTAAYFFCGWVIFTYITENSLYIIWGVLGIFANIALYASTEQYAHIIFQGEKIHYIEISMDNVHVNMIYDSSVLTSIAGTCLMVYQFIQLFI